MSESEDFGLTTKFDDVYDDLTEDDVRAMHDCAWDKTWAMHEDSLNDFIELKILDMYGFSTHRFVAPIDGDKYKTIQEMGYVHYSAEKDYGCGHRARKFTQSHDLVEVAINAVASQPALFTDFCTMLNKTQGPYSALRMTASQKCELVVATALFHQAIKKARDDNKRKRC